MLNKIQQKKLMQASGDVVTQFLRKYSKAGQQIHLLGKSMFCSTYPLCYKIGNILLDSDLQFL